LKCKTTRMWKMNFHIFISRTFLYDFYTIFTFVCKFCKYGNYCSFSVLRVFYANGFWWENALIILVLTYTDLHFIPLNILKIDLVLLLNLFWIVHILIYCSYFFFFYFCGENFLRTVSKLEFFFYFKWWWKNTFHLKTPSCV